MESAQLFAVIRTRGPAWQANLPLDQQRDWQAHAAFMNKLKSDGFVVLGGPLEGTPDVLLIIRAATQAEMISRLDSDPWTRDLLRISKISPWTLRLGTLPA
jgi:hypothetical protein